MQQLNLLKQRGAVLAFSLVMLLLLTLIGVSMIQQNKQGLGMAGNARQQIQVLASAEAALSNAEAAVDSLRYIGSNKGNKKCNSAQQLNEGDVISAAAKVKEVYCLWDYSDAGGTEQRCFYNNGERDLDNPPPPDNACIRLNDAGPGKGKKIADRCPIEIYAIEATVTDSKGAERTVESKYAVDCTGTPD